MRTSSLVLALGVAAATPAFAQHDHASKATKADSIVAVAKTALGTHKDSATLRAAGYFVIGFGAGTRDLTPFQGQHWIAFRRFGQNPPTDIASPEFLMFLPAGDSLIPVGVAYTQRIAADAPVMSGLAGDAAEWHTHIFCRQIPGEGNVLADGVDDCKARGGNPAPNKIAMVHTWTIPNPDGPYAHDNPALPFIATGLAAPTKDTRDDRLFAVALGESYGARLFVAHRIERDVKRAGGSVDGLNKHRAALRDLVPKLRDAERRGDAKAFASLRKEALDHWSALADEYRAIAPTPEIKARFDFELSRALQQPHAHM